MVVAAGQVFGNKGCSHGLVCPLARPAEGLMTPPESAGIAGNPQHSSPQKCRDTKEPAGPDLGGVRTNGLDHQA
ncbi:hypothetical protein GCM10009712_13390 [Pseudarthrobacter sulfonivorans]